MAKGEWDANVGLYLTNCDVPVHYVDGTVPVEHPELSLMRIRRSLLPLALPLALGDSSPNQERGAA